MYSFPRRVQIVEVGPRDGLQNETAVVSVEARLSLIEALVQAGLKRIECGSFVSPSRVPQMASTPDVFDALPHRPGITYSALVPNLRGLEQAIACHVPEVAVFVSASEAFSEANLRCSIAESLSRAENVMHEARRAGIAVRAYLSCVLGCPFSGDVEVARVAELSRTLHQLGCFEISLGDTIGVGTPRQAQRMLTAVAAGVPLQSLAVHYHDTWGQALANIFASLELGISLFDSSVAGLGGCPYAPGATGNVATEDLVYLLDGMDIETGVNLARVAAAGDWISGIIGKPSRSKAAHAIAGRRTRS